MKFLLLPLFICSSIFLSGCLEDEKPTSTEAPTIDVTVNINSENNDKKDEPSSREALRNVYAK